jgi:hypothetical protein
LGVVVRQAKIESALRKVSQDMNKNCPQIMNKYITLISTSAQGDTLKMWYHFDKENFIEDTGTNISQYAKLEKDAKIIEFCGAEASGFRSIDAKMKVIYRNIDNSYLFNFTVDKSDCITFH